MIEIVIREVFNKMKLPSPNVKWHYEAWPDTLTPSNDKTFYRFTNLTQNDIFNKQI